MTGRVLPVSAERRVPCEVGEIAMAVCDWCGVREAFLLAKANQPKVRRPELLLCKNCWDGKWSFDDYQVEALSPPSQCVSPMMRLQPKSVGRGEPRGMGSLVGRPMQPAGRQYRAGADQSRPL